MEQPNRYLVEVHCRDKRWWRYNVELLCGTFDEEGQRSGFVASTSRIAEVGANLKEPPAGVQVPETITLETPPCTTAKLFLYVIPHSLPTERSVEAVAPLRMTIRLLCNGVLLREEVEEINPWGGASVAMQLTH